MKIINEVRNQLNYLKSDKLQAFSSTITKCVRPMLGVSVPNLRKLAKQIVLNDTILFLDNNPLTYYEDMLLQGFVIGYSKLDIETKLNYLSQYIPLILDWSECDCTVATCKFISKNLELCYPFLLKFFNSEKEFEKRFAIICFMTYYLTPYYFQKILNMLLSVKSEHYYVKMAVAWALSVCFVKDYDQTYLAFVNFNLDKFTFNKTIQKCKESFRLTQEQKEKLCKCKIS